MKCKKLVVLSLAFILSLMLVITVKAASGTCEVFYFNYPGSVGEGGSASIKTYLDEIGYTANRYVNIHAYYVRRTMNEDKVFAIVSHGLPGRVICKDGITTMSASAVASDNNNYSLAMWFGSNDLYGLKFAYYGACYSAKTDSTYGNVTTYTTGTLGASCALGFTEAVSNSCATYYETRLFYYLKNGYSVSSANTLALTDTYNYFGTYGYVDSAYISGTSSTTIN